MILRQFGYFVCKMTINKSTCKFVNIIDFKAKCVRACVRARARVRACVRACVSSKNRLGMSIFYLFVILVFQIY